MSAFLFGQCGCCRGGLVTEQQAVVAGLPFTMGWEYNVNGDIIGNTVGALGKKWPPQTIYLTMTTDYIDGATGQIVNTFVVTYNIYGKMTASGVGGWPDTVSIRQSQSRLSDPYTYAQATANVVAMLGNVDLINPNRVYKVETANRDFYTPWSLTVPTALAHLTYPSEAAGYAPDVCLSTIFVHADENGVIWLSNQDFRGSVGTWAAAAMNGFMNTIFTEAGNFYLSGWIVAQKTAVRTPVAFNSRWDYNVVLANAANYERIAGIAPVNIGPGELLFDPSDVPIIGMSFWRTDQAPPLPPAKPTASETNVTADDMNTTADQQ